MRQFLRDIWKTAPKKTRMSWKHFLEGVRDGSIKIMKKADLAEKMLDNKAKKV